MVTSSPTPDYVLRVTRVFKDNGYGVRGDIAAVIVRPFCSTPKRAVRARSTRSTERIREPALFWTAMLRALDVQTDGVSPSTKGIESGQSCSHRRQCSTITRRTTRLGRHIPAPEFGIFTSGEFLNRANQVNDLLFNVDQLWASHEIYGWGPRATCPMRSERKPTASGVSPRCRRCGRVGRSAEQAFPARDDGPRVQDYRQRGQQTAAGDALRRVRLAINLTLTSIEYQVQK